MTFKGLHRALFTGAVAAGLLLAGCATESTHQSRPPLRNMVETLKQEGSFQTLVRALDAAELTQALSSGSYTLFAPTDEAFEKMRRGSLEDLLRAEDKGDLKDFLLQHVVSGRYTARELPGVMSLRTVQGRALTVGYRKSPLIVDGVPVTRPDLETLNGVIHVMSGVLGVP